MRMNDMLLKLWIGTEHKICRPVGRKLKRLHEDHEGGIAEYAVIVGLAVVFGIVILTAFWEQIETFFGELGTKIGDILNAR
jgi:Flp pilus assembly pilin Flp